MANLGIVPWRFCGSAAAASQFSRPCGGGGSSDSDRGGGFFACIESKPAVCFLLVPCRVTRFVPKKMFNEVVFLGRSNSNEVV